MCTLVVAWQVFETAPVCVAANRDEIRDRPSTPPAVRGEVPRFLAPRDDRAGGTWIGFNEHGVLVAVTNRWTPGEGERSRGLLVADALGERTAEAAVAAVESELENRRYSPFYLLVADASDCLLVEAVGRSEDAAAVGRSDAAEAVARAGGGHAVHELEPGVHVVVNVGFDGEWFVPSARPEVGRRQARNAEGVHEALQPESREAPAEWTSRAGDVLGDHDYGVCVHGDGFGTRSSSLIRLGETRSYAFADGPPCETTYEPVNDMI